GHAVLCSRAAVGKENFAVVLADDLIDAQSGALSQMMDAYHRTGCNVLGVENVDPQQTGAYGIVETAREDSFDYVKSIVEKPHPDEAPSHLGVVGRYILSARIFDFLTNLPRGAGGEIQLTDAIARLLTEQKMIAYAFAGRRYDCGDKLGYLEATVAYGMKHPLVGEEFKKLLQRMVC
ncbi:MAG: UTP--glucose-1-phosphate uridylyltransferase, partial [Snodgrassella sp.]|nr:UTP--glucose-1-phosphate uridylyltransferase [Snodgrassella sp.]